MRVPPLDSGAAAPPPVRDGIVIPGALPGSWSATRWEYTDGSGRRVDLVAELGGIVTLSLSAGTWVLTFAVPGRGVRSAGGTFAADGHTLALRPVPEGAPVVLAYRVSADTLSWNDAHSGWDFDGDGVDEAASLVAVFVRI
jgi:hypothetical protein